ncbi:hypothetical protein F5X99DRAFT_347533 [Biscogniauxia marginata]|nr:hypothetical protein F5X99DRAFT_347533 [Biscogniauxia marginata]
MTKPWEMHETTIKRLYSENKLADVRRIMSEEYNFIASTRAYRGRLKRWGTHKYNCKRRNERASSAASSRDICWGSSDATSSMMAPYSMASTYNVASGYTEARRIGDSSQMETLDRVGQQCVPTDSSYGLSYDESSRNKVMLSPPNSDVSFSWSVPITHTSTSSDGFGHAGASTSPTYFECTPLTPPPNAQSSTVSYPTEHHPHTSVNQDLGFYQSQNRHNSIGHVEIPYIAVRDYGFEHGSGPGSGLPDDSIDGDLDTQEVKHNPSSDE